MPRSRITITSSTTSRRIRTSWSTWRWIAARREEVRRRFAELRTIEDDTYGADWVTKTMAPSVATSTNTL